MIGRSAGQAGADSLSSGPALWPLDLGAIAQQGRLPWRRGRERDERRAGGWEGGWEIRTLIGHSAAVVNGHGGGGRAGLPELPPLLRLGLLAGVRVDLVVAVEEDVLLQRRVLVHALELGHADNRLLPFSARAGARPLHIIVGRHIAGGGLENAARRAQRRETRLGGWLAAAAHAPTKLPATRRGRRTARADADGVWREEAQVGGGATASRPFSEEKKIEEARRLG